MLITSLLWMLKNFGTRVENFTSGIQRVFIPAAPLKRSIKLATTIKRELREVVLLKMFNGE